jgi:hypothetical protein
MQTSTFLGFVETLNDKAPRHGNVFFLPYHRSHLSRLRIDQPDVVAASKYIDIPAVLDNQAQRGPAVTAFIADRPVACFGAYMFWNGVAEAWLVTDVSVRYRPIQLTKVARLFMDTVETSLRLHRLHMTVKKDDNKAVKWARALGFASEGVLAGYGPDGSDFLMMAR